MSLLCLFLLVTALAGGPSDMQARLPRLGRIAFSVGRYHTKTSFTTPAFIRASNFQTSFTIPKNVQNIRFFSTAQNSSPTISIPLRSTTTKNQELPLNEQTSTKQNQTDKNNRSVGRWLLGCGGLVAVMVLVGGITRLTESGLSITDWKPLVGAVPPLSEADWIAEFEKYKQFPEYKRLNLGMTLSEFKKIYFWEYAHRLLGRAIGIAFFFPFVYYLRKGYINRTLAWQLGGVFTLGGMQGALGWYMVKSGLDERLLQDGVPRVSQYRLAAHLGSAFVIYVSLMWLAFGLLKPSQKPVVLSPEAQRLLPLVKRFAPICLGMIFLTAISGAFVAGLDAGLIYNTFPYMGEQLIPEGVWLDKYKPKIKNMTENEVTVQFQHRVLAITTFVMTCSFYAVARRAKLPPTTMRSVNLLMGVATAQVTLGISALLAMVPVWLGAAHQTGALSLMTAALWVVHKIRLLPK